MIFVGYSLLLVFVALTVVSELSRRKIAVDSFNKVSALNAVTYLVQIPIGLSILPFIEGESQVSWLIVAIVTLIGIAPPLREYFMFKANRDVDAGTLAILLNLSVVVVVVLAAVLLDDYLNALELAAALLITASAMYVASLSSGGLNVTSSLLWALILLTALGALANLGEAWFFSKFSLAVYLLVGLIAQTFWAFVIAVLAGSDFQGLLDKDGRRSIIAYVASRATKGVIFLSALAILESIATVRSIIAVAPVAITVASYYLLDEKDDFARKTLAALVACLGLVMFATQA